MGDFFFFGWGEAWKELGIVAPSFLSFLRAGGGLGFSIKGGDEEDGEGGWKVEERVHGVLFFFQGGDRGWALWDSWLGGRVSGGKERVW